MTLDEKNERPLWFLTLTQSCNLRCIYCGSDENFDIEDLSPHPREMDFPLEKLEFLKKEKPAPAICFYGGEPLVRWSLMEKIMDDVLGRDFEGFYVLQTNGLLLDKIDDDHLKRFRTILVSVDGDAKTTDMNRGNGTYEKAIAQVCGIRSRGFNGDVIARMTVGEWSDIYDDVTHLLGTGLFDHVHWQLDVLWDSPKFARWDDFLSWRNERYNPQITKLCEEFAAEVRRGKILGIAPIMGLAWNILAGKPVTHVRCSSGQMAFNVTTGGLVTSCPIAAEFDPIGDIKKDAFDPVEMHGTVKLGREGHCEKCDIFGDCGGRCLYASHTNWWDDDGFDEVCVTVRHLVKCVREIVVPACREAMSAGLIDVDALRYPEYNNTIEIIP